MQHWIIETVHIADSRSLFHMAMRFLERFKLVHVADVIHALKQVLLCFSYKCLEMLVVLHDLVFSKPPSLLHLGVVSSVQDLHLRKRGG